MARKIAKLSPAAVRAAKRPGLHGDGAGLWLNVGPTGGKSWVFRYMMNGRAREMGLGPLHVVGLADARDRAAAARRLVLDGIDPLTARNSARSKKMRDAAAAVTFRAAAGMYIEGHRAGWRNAKHAEQWGATLATYVYPVMGDLPVAEIETAHVTRVLTPIWTTKSETAGRVRGRIEAVLDFAKVRGWRAAENPARWKSHLSLMFPARGKIVKVIHHPALPWPEIAGFMGELAAQPGSAALALRFAILTAARTGEVLGAIWAEIDLAGAVWIVPAERMKAGREHRVPLSEQALAILSEAAALRQSDSPTAPVFPGGRGGARSVGLSNMAMLVLLRRMGRGDLTAHGFRSTFRDWAAEATGVQREVAEAALAHAVGDKVEAAYRRGDLFEKRRVLMNAWAEFCTGGRASENVIALRREPAA